MAKRKEPKNSKSQLDLLMEYFKKNPNRDVKHPEIVDWATSTWKRRTGNVFRDPDRGIRQLHQRGHLIKVKKGVYRYDPKAVKQRELYDFTAEQKAQILKRDDYKCVVCGKGKKEGVDLQVDHIRPKELGGRATLENGQTLCGPHNFQKKYFSQTETGKKMFIRLYELAKKEKNIELQKFCEDILETYKKHHINGHIVWEK